MKLFTIMVGLDQSKSATCKTVHGEMDLKELVDCFPDLDDSQALKSMFRSDRIKHIVICFYKNLEGKMKRRFGAMSYLPKDRAELTNMIREMGETLEMNMQPNLKIVPELKDLVDEDGQS